MRSNARMKSSITPSTEKESTTNDNGSSTDEAESEGNNRLAGKGMGENVCIISSKERSAEPTVKLVHRNTYRTAICWHGRKK